MERIFKVGTRTSPLALRQAEEVLNFLKREYSFYKFEIVGFQTTGDKNKKTPLSKVEKTNFFTKKIDQALIKDKIDFAIHSAKDLPPKLSSQIEIAALTQSRESRDVLVSKSNKTLQTLPKGARVGTSSQRRKEQLKAYRPDLKIVDIRGNIGERLELVENGFLDGVIVAGIAMMRLGLQNRITQKISSQILAPHPLQGNLALTVKKENTDLKKMLSVLNDRKINIPKQKFPKVFLVGAGPGDPDLITIKGLKALKKADVILYDFLAPCDLLSQAKKKAERIFVGKTAGRHSLTQDKINELILTYAQAGKTVVRLKGGDPFIFGRGSEEVDFLNKKGIEVEVIPGVSSAHAVPAQAGIPLTHRGISSSYAVVSGYSAEKNFKFDPPSVDTLVVLMGVLKLEENVNRLLKLKNFSRKTPCALIEKGTLPDERVVMGRLGDIVSKAKSFRIKAPAVFIVGNTVSLRNRVPQKQILVTGTNVKRFQNLGQIEHVPAIRLESVSDFKEADKVIDKLSRYNWILFTSQFGVCFFLDRVKAKRKQSKLRNKTIVAIGKTTAEELLGYGVEVNHVPWEESAEGIVRMLKRFDLKGKRILIPRSNIAGSELVASLKKAGAVVKTLTIYKNKKNRISIPNLDLFDEIVFSSPSGVDSFFSQQKKQFSKPVHRAIGPVTEQTLYRYVKKNKVVQHVS